MVRASGSGVVGAALALLLAPAAALACPACYGGDEGPLATYFLTGVLMSLLPLGLIALIGACYLRSSRSRRPARKAPAAALPGVPTRPETL